MCFSATASFTTAAVTGAIGVLAISRASQTRAIPLAAMPLLFAAQQAVEGLLWHRLPTSADGGSSQVLTETYLLFALVLWPAFAPAAALLIEPDRTRRRAIAIFAAAGAVVAAHLLWLLATGSQSARIAGGHIVYDLDPSPPAAAGLAYLLATAGALGLSTHASIRALAAIVLVGSLVAYFAYWDAFLSVWCFFAAAASGVILFHFERERRLRQQAAPRQGPA